MTIKKRNYGLNKEYDELWNNIAKYVAKKIETQVLTIPVEEQLRTISLSAIKHSISALSLITHLSSAVVMYPFYSTEGIKYQSLDDVIYGLPKDVSHHIIKKFFNQDFSGNASWKYGKCYIYDGTESHTSSIVDRGVMNILVRQLNHNYYRSDIEIVQLENEKYSYRFVWKRKTTKNILPYSSDIDHDTFNKLLNNTFILNEENIEKLNRASRYFLDPVIINFANSEKMCYSKSFLNYSNIKTLTLLKYNAVIATIDHQKLLDEISFGKLKDLLAKAPFFSRNSDASINIPEANDQLKAIYDIIRPFIDKDVLFDPVQIEDDDCVDVLF